MSERLILLTNDDGLWAPGLAVLARVASRFGRVVTVAPDRNRSAISSALSLHNILRLHEIGPDRHACDGTPVDCVLLGVCEVLDRRPDWVLSGINHGFNLGEDVFYSGTVGAAFEGRLQGARAAAFSIDPRGSLEQAEPWIGRFLERWETMELPANRIWNVNFPKGEPQGFRLTGQDSRAYHDLVERRADPRNTPYFWIGGDAGPTYAKAPGSDAEAVFEGFASVTPLRLDLGCPETLARQADFDSAFNGPAGA
ncbi:5'/3'-nucleotidase SurE [Geothrix alkalitolerans]|uniref:5'/3'-nucleotidase SurE n=1 Tax=Geothrix alkalitolerans TaxID=2922724 RepID=UPI001FAEAF17|nr:5'/3'-nucleotidase SurE [Geothrix alkalitolerans]